MKSNEETVPELSEEVLKVCREVLSFEEVEELQALYSAIHKRNGVVRKKTRDRNTRSQIEAAQLAAAELRQNAVALEQEAIRARAEAKHEANELRSLVKSARRRGWVRRVHESQRRFEDIAWPAVCCGARIQLAEAKARTVSFADTLVSDWRIFEKVIENSQHIAQDDEEDALPSVYREASVETAARLSALGQVSRGNPKVLEAIKRQRDRCEKRLLDAFLFAAALRPDDILSENANNTKHLRTRQRDQARARTAAQALAVLGSASSLERAWRTAIYARVATAMDTELSLLKKDKKNNTDSIQARDAVWLRLRSTLRAARSILCGDLNTQGEVRALLKVTRSEIPGDTSTLVKVDACAAAIRAVAGSLEGLGLKSALLQLLAAADYEDADRSEQNPPPSVWLDSLARACRSFVAFERSLADQFRTRPLSRTVLRNGTTAIIPQRRQTEKKKETTQKTSDGRRGRHHDDFDACDSDLDDHDPVRRLQHDASSEDDEDDEEMAEVRLALTAGLDEVLAEARRSYEARETAWLKRALRCAAEAAAMATEDETAVSMDESGALAATLGGVRQDASLESIMSGPLRQGALDPAFDAVASVLHRASLILPGDAGAADTPALPLAQVRALLMTGDETPAYREKSHRLFRTAEEFGPELLRLGRAFVYDCALRPSIAAAAQNCLISSAAESPVAFSDYNGGTFSSLLMRGTRPGSPWSNGNGMPPPALYDVVFAALDTEARWRQREDELGLGANDKVERETHSAHLRAELSDSLLARAADAVASHLGMLFEEASPKARKAFAAKRQPDKLAPTPATVQAADLLKNHSTVVAHAMLRQQNSTSFQREGSHYDRARDVAKTLYARWRLALADAVFAKFRHYVYDSVPAISVYGAFVVAKDVDYMKSVLTELGSASTDTKLSELRENLSLLKLENNQLAATLLHDTSLAPRNLESLLSKRADAFTRLGGNKRAQWLTKLLDEVQLVQSVHQRAAVGRL